jgi:hypothetical protein
MWSALKKYMIKDTLINWGSAPNLAGGNDFPRTPSLYLIEITMRVQEESFLCRGSLRGKAHSRK